MGYGPGCSALPQLRAAVGRKGRGLVVTPLEMVREFHLKVGAAIRTEPQADVPHAIWRAEFVEEEARELREAIEAGDIVGIADALGDLAHFVYGAALIFGIPIDEVIAEIHRSNMTKEPTGDAKAIKGPSYSPPNLVPILKGRSS